MKKKIPIACFIVVLMLLVPLTAVAGRTININTYIKTKQINVVNENTVSANQMQMDIKTKVSSIIQDLDQQSNIFMQGSPTLRWLDCLFLFIFTEIVYNLYANAPTGSDESEFWHNLYDYLDGLYDDRCLNESAASASGSVDCGCAQSSSQSTNQYMNTYSSEQIKTEIQASLDLAFKDYNNPKVATAYNIISANMQKSDGFEELCDWLDDMVDQAKNKVISLLNQDDVLTAWIIVFLTSPFVAAQYVICESDLIPPGNGNAVAEPVIIKPITTQVKTITTISPKYPILSKINVVPGSYKFERASTLNINPISALVVKDEADKPIIDTVSQGNKITISMSSLLQKSLLS